MEAWRPLSRLDLRLGKVMQLQIRGRKLDAIPTSIEELPLPCDAGARAVLSFRLVDGAQLAGVRLDECRIAARVYPDSITRQQVEAAVFEQRLIGVRVAPLIYVVRDYLIRCWGLIDDDGRPFAIPRRPMGSTGIRFETRGRKWFEDRQPYPEPARDR